MWTTAAAVFGCNLVCTTADDRDHAYAFCEELPPGDEHPTELDDWWVREPLRRMHETLSEYRHVFSDHPSAVSL